MKENYKRPLLIKILNLFLYPKNLKFNAINKWYENKYAIQLPPKVKKYLKLILEEVYTENKFDPFGKLLFNIFIKENLKNLAYVEKNHKEFNQKCIFIIGLPRTGSTFFHKLLARSPELSALKFWELNKIGRYNLSVWRRLQGKLMLLMQNYLTPEIAYIHKVDNEGPEECSKILLCTFITQIYPIMFRLPKYEKELLNENFDFTYNFYKKSLSLIKNDKKTLVLKAPMHLQALDQLDKHFPNTKFIFLHRELKSVLPSSYSLARTYSHMFIPKINESLQIESIHQRLSHDLNNAIAYAGNIKNLVHLSYSDITSETPEVIKRLNHFLKLEIKDLNNKKEKDKKHLKHKYQKITSIPNEFKEYQNFLKEKNIIFE